MTDMVIAIEGIIGSFQIKVKKGSLVKEVLSI